ncbi:MAG TPA: trypsin-like serine protease [Polyangiaceae bacterium]
MSIIRPVLVLGAAAFLVSACSGELERPGGAGSSPAAEADAGGVVVDDVEVVNGVPDHGRNPAVVALDVGGQGLCTGTLIAPDVVLTARHCVSITSEKVQCPPSGPQIGRDRTASSIGVYAGEDARSATLVARGRELVVPKSTTLCDHDIAAIVLDRDVEGVAPLRLAKQAPKRGDTVRAVGFGKSSDADFGGIKLLRDHVKILEVSTAEFLVGEATCQGDSGGPALDESTGDIVGVVSRGGPSCEGSGVHNVYTRTDAFQELLSAALAKSGAGPALEDDAGVVTPPSKDAGAKTPKPTKPVTDMGDACTKGADCAAGVCVKDGGNTYCSRPCGTGDRCPSGYNCKKISTTKSVCIAH